MLEPYTYAFKENAVLTVIIFAVYFAVRFRGWNKKTQRWSGARQHAYQYLVVMFILSGIGSLTVLPVALWRLDAGMIAWQGTWVGLGIGFGYDAYRRYRARAYRAVELERRTWRTTTDGIYDKDGRRIYP